MTPTPDAPKGATAWRAVAAQAVLVASMVGCERSEWTMFTVSRAPDAAVIEALDDFDYAAPRPISAAEVPAISPPTKLRPCCAFGTDLKVEVGAVPVPGFVLDNLVGPDDVGPHKYGAGMMFMSGVGDRKLVEREHNGLVYTCRGGFVDLAHVRDNADMTLFLAASIARTMDTGGTIDLPPQGGPMRVVLKAVPPSDIEDYGRRLLALRMAQWAAFQVSIWHEIATFYGYTSLPSWPEKVSAFSPEDLYSNMLGIKITGGIVLLRQTDDELQYNRSVDAWIRQVLERLDAVSKRAAIAATKAVDGLWWDSSKRLPNWELVRRRDLDIDGNIAPWLVSQVRPGEDDPAGCDHDTRPLSLHNPDGFEGLRFDEYMTFEVEPGAAIAQMPMPRPGSRTITQADFPWLIEQIRRESVAAFGSDADRPG